MITRNRIIVIILNVFRMLNPNLRHVMLNLKYIYSKLYIILKLFSALICKICREIVMYTCAHKFFTQFGIHSEILFVRVHLQNVQNIFVLSLVCIKHYLRERSIYCSANEWYGYLQIVRQNFLYVMNGKSSALSTNFLFIVVCGDGGMFHK